MAPLKNTLLAYALFDKAQKPAHSLLHLLTLMNMQHCSDRLDLLVAETQSWLRPQGQERWENKKTFPYSYEALEHLFKDLCLIEAVKSLNKEYTYGVLLGGDIHDVCNRLSYVIRLWNEGVRFETLVVFTGQRFLDDKTESPEIIEYICCKTLPCKEQWYFKEHHLPATETDMIKLVFDHTDLPSDWQDLPLIFIDTPLQKTNEGGWRRPNTYDTTKEWLAFNPKPGSILAVSSQPFIGYQDSVLRRAIPSPFVIETVGDALTTNDATVPLLLDSLGRWIYNDYHLIKAGNELFLEKF